jgi:hypothetical protein
MLNIVNLEEIQGLLLRVPVLIRELDARDPNFAGSVKAWLTQGEQILTSNRLTVAAQVAALRGVLISAERGAVPSGMAFTKRTTTRTIKDAAAADVLRRAEELMSSAIHADTLRFAEGEKLTRQIVAVAHRKKLTDAPGVDKHPEILKTIWQAMVKDPDLAAATTHLVGLVGPHDVLILLDRMLPTP